MKKYNFLITPLLALCLPLMGILSGGCAPDASLQSQGKAEKLSVSKWVKGEPADVTDGKNVYVVEFWATWCPPCRQSIPHLTELQKKYKDRGVVFVGISNEKAETVETFVTEQGGQMDYVVALDQDNATHKNYMSAHGQQGIPCAFLISKEGEIVWIGHPMALESPLKDLLSRS
ncbi:MAG TPA: TlpA disulfide reductase family protein [Verrucomicrobiota bacterium]|nr:TlpA disulfide reductase family protein [Verrucomicrobiota bacterium]